MNARAVVRLLLEEEEIPGYAGNIRIKLQDPEGRVHDALFGGYWELGQQPVPNVGYPMGEDKPGQPSFSHGALKPGWKILTPVPSYEEWRAQQKAQPAPRNRFFDRLKRGEIE